MIPEVMYSSQGYSRSGPHLHNLRGVLTGDVILFPYVLILEVCKDATLDIVLHSSKSSPLGQLCDTSISKIQQRHHGGLLVCLLDCVRVGKGVHFGQ